MNIGVLKQEYELGATLKELSALSGIPEETLRRRLISAGTNMRPRGHGGRYKPSGGRVVDKDGYVLLLQPDHPYANSGGYVREHRLVMEKQLGRYLLPTEVVHHKNNNDKQDNTPDNLVLYPSNAEHKRQEMIGNTFGRLPKPKNRGPRGKNPTPQELLDRIRSLAQGLDRLVRRSDLQPPAPSYRAVARAFGDWRTGVERATGQRPE